MPSEAGCGDDPTAPPETDDLLTVVDQALRNGLAEPSRRAGHHHDITHRDTFPVEETSTSSTMRTDAGT